MPGLKRHRQQGHQWPHVGVTAFPFALSAERLHQSATTLLRSPCFLFLVWGIFYCLKVALQPICLEALKQYRVSLLSSNSSQERPNINFSVYFLRVCTSTMALNRGTRTPSLPLLGEGRRVPGREHCVYSYRLCKCRDKHQSRKTKHLLLIHSSPPAHELHLIICERERYSLTLQNSLASQDRSWQRQCPP